MPTEMRSRPQTKQRRIGFRAAPSARWAVMAACVGLAVGLACIALEFLTQAVASFCLSIVVGYSDAGALAEHRFFQAANLESELTMVNALRLIAVISIGGLVSGWLVYRWADEAAGAGTDASVNAFHNQKGFIRGRVIWVKTLASAITLGTAGSAGKEGPIALIGAGIGSLFAQKLKLSASDRRILLAAGMGAGVGAMFRAPLAGAIFAAEIMYSDADVEADVLVPGAVASIIAYSVYTQSIAADVRYQPIFGEVLGQYRFTSPGELAVYLLLGLFVFALAVGYTRLFHATGDLFAKLSVKPKFRPAIGGAVAGLVGILVFCLGGFDERLLAVLGTGYGTLQEALVGGASLSVGMLLAVAFGKMLTSSLSIGSGGSGGAFGPSMVIGGCAGAAFGMVAHDWAPSLVPHPETCGVVGMAGFFAGVARAPISTIIMVRELTGGFGLLVPTMLVCTFTFVASSRFRLYRSQCPTRMESPAHRGDFLVDVLEGLRVEDVFRADPDVIQVHEGETLERIVHLLAESRQHYFPVVDSDGKMTGLFSDNDVRSYLYDESIWLLANAADVMTSPFEKVLPSDDLNVAMGKFTSTNVDELPVIDEQDSGKLLGFLRRKELIAAYNRRLLEHRKLADGE